MIPAKKTVPLFLLLSAGVTLGNYAGLFLIGSEPLLTTSIFLGITTLVFLLATWLLLQNLRAKLRQLQRELEASRHETVVASKSRSRMLARMSHEIRTPLNGVLGMTELLHATKLDEDQGELVETMHKSAESLLTIVSNIVDFSKIDTGKLRLKSHDVDLQRMSYEIIEKLAGRADRRGVELKTVLPPQFDTALRTDPGRLRQALMNLVDNAIKFTDTGSVTLKVAATDIDSDTVEVTFEVIDTGIGIKADQQESIFNPFVPEDNTATLTHGGSGLGLTICQRIVSQMGGALSVESSVGAGSTFAFSLRMKKGDKIDIGATKKGPTANVRRPLTGHILLAEDNSVNQVVATGMLQSLGLSVTVAANRREAIQRCKENHFDVVLMDCQMPDMDGLHATHAIRAAEADTGKRPVPIIAATANTRSGNRDICLTVGMNDYLTKPFTSDQLYKILCDHLPLEESAGARHSGGAASDASDDDDSPLDRSILDVLVGLQQPGAPSLLCKVINAYLDSSVDLQQKLCTAVDARNADAVREAAHALKSSSANVGALRLAEVCKRLEASGREGNLTDVPRLHGQFEQEYSRVIGALKQEAGSVAA